MNLEDTAAAAATLKATNKLKANVQKNSVKRKASKSLSRRGSKAAPKPKSFLEQNIKNAGTTTTRKRNDQATDNDDTNAENAQKINNQTIPGNKETTTSNRGKKVSKHNEATRKISSKEQKALESAYICLMEEYKRRNEVRKTISVKFGRANAKLKLIMAQQKTENGNQSQKGTLAHLIANNKKTGKQMNTVKEKEHKRNRREVAKVKNYDDPDRI